MSRVTASSETSAFSWPPPATSTPLAVLVSGGLDSAVLLAEAIRTYPAVHPIYVRTGLFWEEAEQRYLARFLEAIRTPVLQPLVVLDMPVRDLYGPHWSITGTNTPMAGQPDEDDYLPGRNVLLFAKPLLWCLAHRVPELATAPLAANPFPDATPAFYDGFAATVGMAVGGRVRVIRPYAALRKPEVIRRGRDLPLEFTFSCVQPADGRPCGLCSKCGERKRGFAAAGVPDPTRYSG